MNYANNEFVSFTKKNAHFCASVAKMSMKRQAFLVALGTTCRSAWGNFYLDQLNTTRRPWNSPSRRTLRELIRSATMSEPSCSSRVNSLTVEINSPSVGGASWVVFAALRFMSIDLAGLMPSSLTSRSLDA